MKKFAAFLFYFTCFLALFSTVTAAYIDPSAMTYIIQIVAGAVITIGATAGFYWRRIKKAAKSKKSESQSPAVSEKVTPETDSEMIWEDGQSEK